MSGGTGSGRSREYKLDKIRRLVERDGPNCKYCNRRLAVDPVPYIVDGITPNDYPTIDHIVSRFNKGTWKLYNLQLLCVPCHRHKSRLEKMEQSRLDSERVS